MTTQAHFPKTKDLTALSRAAPDLSYEVIAIAGFLDLAEEQWRH